MQETMNMYLHNEDIYWNAIAYAGIALLTYQYKTLNLMELPQNQMHCFAMNREISFLKEEKHKLYSNYMNGFYFHTDFRKKESISVSLSPYGQVLLSDDFSDGMTLRIPHHLISPKGIYAERLPDGGQGIETQNKNTILHFMRSGQLFSEPRLIFQNHKTIDPNKKILIPSCRFFVISKKKSANPYQDIFPYTKTGFQTAVRTMYQHEQTQPLFTEDLLLFETNDSGNIYIDKIGYMHKSGCEYRRFRFVNPRKSFWEWEKELPEEMLVIQREIKKEYPEVQSHILMFREKIQKVIDDHFQEIKSYIGEDDDIQTQNYGIYIMQSVIPNTRAMWKNLSFSPDSGLGADSQIILDWHGIQRTDLAFLWLRKYFAFSHDPIPLVCYPVEK